MHDDVCAFREGVELARDGFDEHGHRQGSVCLGIAQRQERHRCAGPSVELHDLPLDPHGRHLVDVLGDLGAKQADGPRIFRRGLKGAGRKRGRFTHRSIIDHAADM